METLDILNKSVLRRSQQIDLLASYLGEKDDQALPAMFVYGLPVTGKTFTIKATVEHLKHKLLLVDCVECYSPRLVFEAILMQLCSHYDQCCLNANSFIHKWQQFFPSRTTVYILFENSERLRDMDAYILAIFMKLQELTQSRVGVILESQVIWEKFREGTGVNEPVLVHFPEYNKNDLLEILQLDCPADFPPSSYQCYVSLLLDVFLLVCRNLAELKYLAFVNFPKYIQPIIDGEVKPTDSVKLWKYIEPHLKNALNSLYLRDSTSQKCSSQRCSLELPVYSKYLLIAAYLASYNPVNLDKRLFVKYSAKRKKNANEFKKKEQRTSNQVLGPKYFTLDRQMAIFHSIVEEKVIHTASILSQISSLVTLGLLSSSSSSTSTCDPLIDMSKYKCLVSLPQITLVSKSVGFEILKYLYDFI